MKGEREREGERTGRGKEGRRGGGGGGKINKMISH